MTWYTHINRNVIDSNRKHGKNEPPIKTQEGKYGKPIYGHAAVLPSGSVLRYSSDGVLLPCGARLVIESKEQPIIESIY